MHKQKVILHIPKLSNSNPFIPILLVLGDKVQSLKDKEVLAQCWPDGLDTALKSIRIVQSFF